MDLSGTLAVVRTDARSTEARAQLAALVERHRGSLVHGGGTGQVVAFRSAPRSVAFSLDLHALDPDARQAVHLGHVVARPGRASGEPLDLTDRILAVTPPGRTYVSAAVRELLHASPRVSFVERGRPLTDLGVEWPVFEALTYLEAPLAPLPLVGQDRLARSLADHVLGARLTLLEAPAGSGKTTALAAMGDVVASTRVTPDADNPSAIDLAQSIVHALRRRVPGLSPTLVALTAGLARGRRDDVRERADTFASFCAQEVADHLTHDLVLVVDAAERLRAAPATSALLASLVRAAPAHLRIVVSGRVVPDLPTERLATTGEVARLGPEAVELTDDECRLVLAGAGIPDGARADRLLEVAAGRPGRLRLSVAAERLRVDVGDDALDATHALLDRLGPSHREVVEVLGATGPLPESLMSHVVGHAIAPLLVDLRDAGLVARDASDGDLLTPSEVAVRACRAPDEARAVWTRRAADLAESSGQVRRALRLWGFVGDRERRARLLRDRGTHLLDAGQWEVVLDAVVAIRGLPSDGTPTDDDAASRELDALAGQAAYLLGDADGALAWYERATAGRTDVSSGLAWRMGLILHMRGEIDHARAVYAVARDDGETRDRSLVRSWDGAGAWIQGDVDTCSDRVIEAMSLAQECGDPQALAAAHTVRAMLAAVEGNRADNDRFYLLALDQAERAGDLLQIIRIHSNRGSLLLEEGSHAEALAEIDLAVRTAELAGERTFRAMALINRGQVLRRLGDLERAAADLRSGQQLMAAAGSRMAGYAMAHLGELHTVRGETALARAALEEALRLARPVSDVQGIVPALARLAVLHVLDDPDTAAALADEAVERSAGALARTEAMVARIAVALRTGDLDHADRLLVEGSDVARRNRDHPGLAALLLLEGDLRQARGEAGAVGLWQQARSLWQGLDSVLEVALADARIAAVLGGSEGTALARQATDRLRAAGAHAWADVAAGALAALEARAATPVQVRVLGGLQVAVDGVGRPTGAWSDAARDVLVRLALSQPAPRASADLAQSLGITQDVVREAVEELRVALAPHGDAMREDAGRTVLDPALVTTDVEHFSRLADDGIAAAAGDPRRARRLLAEAEAASRGPLLAEAALPDDLARRREELHDRAVEVVRTQLALVEAPDDALPLLMRLLEREPHDETAFLRLVTTLRDLGRHGQARREYRRYTQAMYELGVEPAPYPG